MATHILGIRHHGPGSAEKLKKHLAQHPPDMLLIEGPPEANESLMLAAEATMEPPVALLLYHPKKPQIASFYPFACFSPEWQAIQFGLKHNIPIRFMDMPATHALAFQEQEKEEEQGKEEATPPATASVYPLDHLARIAGFEQTDLWWEHQFELHSESAEHFEAVQEAMCALREEPALDSSPRNDIREAFMRSILTQAEAEHEEITVVCGAWHVPALLHRPTKKADRALMKGLPKVPVETTWIPWTYERLAYESGYGAGISSPGWYEHVWQTTIEERGNHWMVKVAQVLRNHQMDISTAHVIEGVRLAHSLAALRELHQAGLQEFNEATSTVLSFGDESFLQLVRRELIVGDKLGAVPPETPAIPLQQDVLDQQRSLRMKPKEGEIILTLDLRKELDAKRSIFLHRLSLLDIRWAQPERVASKGTFKEQWRLYWTPELVLQIVEKGIWGNTVAQAAHAYVLDQADASPSLDITIQLLGKALPAKLEAVVQQLMQRLDEQAALSGDILQLLSAMPPLLTISRYGDVRQTDGSLLESVLEGIISRVTIGLLPACSALDEESALEATDLIGKGDHALHVSNEAAYLEPWYESLQNLADGEQLAPAVSGKATRLLSDHGLLAPADISRYLSLALSYGREAAYSASWLEGFILGSNILLLLEEEVWEVLNEWVATLEEADFINYLPVIRRSFSLLSPAERRKIGEQAKRKKSKPSTQLAPTELDHQRGLRAISAITSILFPHER